MNNILVDYHSQAAAPSNILDALDRKNSIQKEIAKDIILHKVHKPVAHSTDGVELKYMFIVILHNIDFKKNYIDRIKCF